MATPCCILAHFTYSLCLSGQSHLHLHVLRIFVETLTLQNVYISHCTDQIPKSFAYSITQIYLDKVSAVYLMNHHYIFEPSKSRACLQDCCNAGGLLCFTGWDTESHPGDTCHSGEDPPELNLWTKGNNLEGDENKTWQQHLYRLSYLDMPN